MKAQRLGIWLVVSFCILTVGNCATPQMHHQVDSPNCPINAVEKSWDPRIRSQGYRPIEYN